MSYRTGARLRCTKCHAELIVLKPGNVPLTCCDTEMEIVSSTAGGKTRDKQKEGEK